MVRKLTIPSHVNRILTAQWLVTFCVAGVLLAVSREFALSALLGGLICALPNWYFARQIFTQHRTAEPYSILGSIYAAEFIKVVLAVALFAIVFIKYKEVHPLTLFITYFITQSCMWIVPIFISSNPIIKQSH